MAPIDYGPLLLRIPFGSRLAAGTLSSVAVYADGSVIDMATIGREGCTGMQAFFGAKTSSVRLLAFMDDVAQTLDKCDVHL